MSCKETKATIEVPAKTKEETIANIWQEFFKMNEKKPQARKTSFLRFLRLNDSAALYVLLALIFVILGTIAIVDIQSDKAKHIACVQSPQCLHMLYNANGNTHVE